MSRLFEKCTELLLPIGIASAGLWIAAVQAPATNIWLSFVAALVGLFLLSNLFEKTIHNSHNHKLSLIQTGLLMLALGLLIGVLDLFIDHTTLNLCIAAALLFCLYLFCLNRHKRWAVLLYCGLFCLSIPFAFNLQGKDIETVTWLVYLGFFFWLLVSRSLQQVLHSEKRSDSHLLGLAFLLVFSFGWLTLMGIFSGQSSFFFIGLLIVLGLFSLSLLCLKKQQALAAYLMMLPAGIILTATTFLSYHF